MIGASIYDVKSQKGTTTNVYGFYSLTLPADTVNIVIRYIGYQTSFNKLFLNPTLSSSKAVNILFNNKISFFPSKDIMTDSFFCIFIKISLIV